jgi:hypothetical protein
MRFRAPALAAFLFAADARAQLHWDASAQAGVSRRVLARAPGAAASFGPAGQLAAHVALLPFVHVGAYVGLEHSPVGESSRNIGFAGTRAKGMIPGLSGPVRAWIFAGFGYALAYGTSRGATVLVPNEMGGTEPRSGRIEGASGGFFEVPFGFGASYTFFKPWAIAVELGARVGLAHSGALYDGPPLTLDAGLPQRTAPDGLDRFGLGLLVGILYDR